jgi:CO dehydrogenase maturation factor
LKIAISGKGGTGKTTLTALLAQTYADRGREVLAVDSDPSPCLANALAFPDELLAELQPIAKMEVLIEERTGAKPGAAAGFFTLNPRVDDLPDRFSAMHDGVRLLEMGSVESGGGGCICPESAMLKTLFTHLLFRKDEVLLMDMYAGVEHLGRATVGFVDTMLVVVEPTRRSLTTAKQIKKLAEDIGLTRLWLVGNRIRNQEDASFLEKEAGDLPVLGYLPDDPGVIEADHGGVSVYARVPSMKEAAGRIADQIDQLTHVS